MMPIICSILVIIDFLLAFFTLTSTVSSNLENIILKIIDIEAETLILSKE
jgi:hypothetical protein